MAKSGGDSACAHQRGADRGVPVPQIMTWVCPVFGQGCLHARFVHTVLVVQTCRKLW